ncbi:MAG: hydrogenase maturation protease [Bacteroidetes bacterium]|nr:MAG: hydrogenase maturation protease [Bacteroidota bacterium]
MIQKEKILVYGYGNPGRQDDGLGAALIQKIDEWLTSFPSQKIITDTNYQLNIEDAASVSEASKVIFVDASIEEIENFSFTEVKASDARVEFSMHAVSPAFVIDLCTKMYGKAPNAYLLHIKGYEWDFREELTPGAQTNLSLAFEFLCDFLKPNL